MSFQPNPASQPETRARVVFGPYEETSDLWVGQTIAQIRMARGGAWSIPRDAKVIRGREEVGETYQVKRGDVIEFVKRQGDKG